MENLSDDELVRLIRIGDDPAFAELVRRYNDRLFRLARAMLARQHLAVDAVQEVFLRAFKGFGNFRFGASVYTWLYAILRNVCRELNRKEMRMENTAATEVADPRPPIEQLVDDEQRLQYVLDLLKRLPERQRDVFLLRVLEGLSVAEVARILRCREGTVKAHLHRALQRIKQHDPAAIFE